MWKRMLDLYDRALLELKYSSQNFDEIADNLKQTKVVCNHVGLGSCLTSMTSGGLGLVAAALFFTPMGPPMMLSSLPLGGTATAITTGKHYFETYSKGHQTANKNIALAAMVSSLLEATAVLRDAKSLVDENNNMDCDYDSNGSDSSSDEDDVSVEEVKIPVKDKSNSDSNGEITKEITKENDKGNIKVNVETNGKKKKANIEKVTVGKATIAADEADISTSKNEKNKPRARSSDYFMAASTARLARFMIADLSRIRSKYSRNEVSDINTEENEIMEKNVNEIEKMLNQDKIRDSIVASKED